MFPGIDLYQIQLAIVLIVAHIVSEESHNSSTDFNRGKAFFIFAI
jgi:hypothetical protein